MEHSILKRRLARCAGRACVALLLLGAAMSVSSCHDDLLVGTPEWLGSNVYDELDSRGQFKHTLELIDDPDLYKDGKPVFAPLLKKTGSMTIFVADDASWDRFLKRHGVTRVADLPASEKRNLLKATMIDNAYLIELLSNLPATSIGESPAEGQCFRRESRVSIQDSLPIMYETEFPPYNTNRLELNSTEVTDYWKAVRGRGSIKIYKDNSAAPMVHLLPRFMNRNNFTDDDLRILTNGESTDIKRSYINGKAVSLNDGRWADRDVEMSGEAKKYLDDIVCQNGYIHILDDVPEQLPNMAEILRSKPQFSIFSELLDRFSYPYYIAMQEVNGKQDSIFVLAYFNSGKAHDNSRPQNVVRETGRTVSSVLPWDPGWNQYALNDANGMFQKDGAAIFAPTNDWMNDYLLHDGAAIGAKYCPGAPDWSKVPDNIVLPFLENCMQTSFVGTIPSKFDLVKSPASQEEIGIKVSDVDSSFMACNGVVYQLNKVFVAPDHKSIILPAMLRADEDLSVIYRSITDTRFDGQDNSGWNVGDYRAYVRSMASTYSFLIPTDAALGAYIDPYSFCNNNKPVAYRFYVDPKADNPISIEAFDVDTTGGKMEVTSNRATSQPTSSQALKISSNRLCDIMDNILVVHGNKGAETFNTKQEIYLNKAGGPVKVQFTGNTVTGIAGSAQIERGSFVPISSSQIFDQSRDGNGITYIMDTIPQSTLTSPYQVVRDTINHPEFTSFARLLAPTCTFIDKTIDTHPTIGYGLSLLKNYNYTIYVPKSSSVDALVASKKLPTWSDYSAWETLKDSVDKYTTDFESQFNKSKAAIEADRTSGAITEDEYTSQMEALETAYDARMDEAEAVVEDCNTNMAAIQDVIENFLRFHIQDGSVFIGGAENTMVYETASIDTVLNRFRRLEVANQSKTISVNPKDLPNSQGAQVLYNTNQNDCNLVARQYLFDTSDQSIWGSSYVVVHLVDQPLIYDSSVQFMNTGVPVPVYPTWLQAWIDANATSSTPSSIRAKR